MQRWPRRAQRTEEHDGARAAVPALADIGALRLLADRVQRESLRHTRARRRAHTRARTHVHTGTSTNAGMLGCT
eukprot:176619-Pleurochrysis_carterae.AAC.5